MNKFFNFVYTITILLMISIVLLLGVLIIDKYHILNLDLFNLTTYLPFENHFASKMIEVANTNDYIKVDENTYHNGSNQVINIDDGIVSDVSDNFIEVRMDNGRKVRYEQLTMSFVKKQERILKGVIIGSSNGVIKIYCYDEKGLPFSYEQY